MKKSNFYLSFFIGITMLSMTITSCGDDDEKDEYKPVLLGQYRTPYVREIQVWIPGSNGAGSTGHYTLCKSFSSYQFEGEGVVRSINQHHKSCVVSHKYDKTNNVDWYPTLNSKGDTLDWYTEGRGEKLSYSIDYDKSKVTLSNGIQYNLKSTGKTVFESLLDERDNEQYVLGSSTDEKYNNVNYFVWLGTLK